MSNRQPGEREEEEDDEERWGEILQRIDSSRYSTLFRNIVLVAGLLRLREDSEAALNDLQVIVKETNRFSKRISSAKSLHPEEKILDSLEKNLTEFSLQADDFKKSLQESELREEIELLSLSLALSRSASPERKARKTRLAERLTKLAKYIKFRKENPGEADTLSRFPKLLRKSRKERKIKESSGRAEFQPSG